MFGSNDDKKAPQGGEKKGLFGWWRKKPQAGEQPADQPVEPVSETAAAEQRAPADDVAQSLTEQPGRQQPSAAEPAEPPAPVAEAPLAGDEPASAEEHSPRPEAPVAQPEPILAAEPEPEPEPVAPLAAAPAVSEPATRPGFFARLRQGLSKTSASIGEGMASLFLGRKEIDDDLLDDIETRLLTADVGVEATTLIVQNLTKRVARKELADSGALYKALQEELASLLRPVEQPLQVDVAREPYVILVVGVNGVGKTTTIGKLAKKLQLEGKKVMLAAGDTFRAAAVEQLQVWGERNRIPVIAQHTGADSASVIFDAVQAAKARGIDVLIADTAGRLHTKDNLMEELRKVRRVIGKLDETAPHEVLL
ncbi:MAG: signaling recognition particle receptor family protein, partial [Pseudomonas aeruginosa]|nr:signaling recognition particle receptor family protein [Pseudomonas aeruginosa]